jgi:hypothetical protein
MTRPGAGFGESTSMRSLTPLAVVLGLAAAGLAADPPLRPAGSGDNLPLADRYGELIPTLIAALSDIDPEVRQHAATALALAGPRAIPPLVEALKDKNRDRRAAAAYALGQAGTAAREATPALLTALKDDDRVVRRQASYALSRIVAQDRNELVGPPEPARAEPPPPAPLPLPVKPEPKPGAPR